MSFVKFDQSRVIDAPADAVYAVLADYRVGHQAILPRPPFKEMIVDEGGYGAGTVIRLRMTVMGKDYHYHMRVTEPEPGRELLETDINTGQYSGFIVEPLDDDTCRVTIHAGVPLPGGIVGMLMRFVHPMIAKPMFRDELVILDEYMRSPQVNPAAV